MAVEKTAEGMVMQWLVEKTVRDGDVGVEKTVRDGDVAAVGDSDVAVVGDSDVAAVGDGDMAAVGDGDVASGVGIGGVGIDDGRALA